MIRKPISRTWRIGLGVASVVLVMLTYTALSSSRQAAARRDQQGVAITRLAELAIERAEIEQRQGDLEDNDADVVKFTKQRDHPDKTDETIPSWSMLIQDGLVRACTPQGSFIRKEIWIVEDFRATGARLCAALFVGVFSSIVVGLLMGCYDPVEAFLLPLCAFFSKVPATAVLPIFFVIVQINFSMYIAIIVFGMFPSLAQAVSASVRKDVPEELIFKAYTLGASQLELIWNVIFKQVLPRILDAIRLQIGPALVLLVAAEWMVAGEGVGYRLRWFFQQTDMAVVFVYVFILGVIGLAADYGLIWLRRKLCPWFGD